MTNLNQKSSQEILKINQAEWDKISIHDLHPDINLIRCQKRLFKESQGKKLLYVGFGEGQNLLYFLQEGFECYGTEISKTRLDFTTQKLVAAKQRAVLKLVDSNILPFVDNFFDVVIAWQSICYNNQAGLQESLNEIHRVLKPDGHFLSSLPSPANDLCGQEIAPSVYRPVNVSEQTNCVLYAFKNKEKIREVYQQFRDIQIGYHASHLFTAQDFHYVIYGRK